MLLIIASIAILMSGVEPSTPIVAHARRYVYRCPKDWFSYRNKCFFFDDSQQVSLRQAYEHCKSKNASLVSIHSERENNFIESFTQRNIGYWIGLIAEDYKFSWIDGSSLNYTNWSMGRPSLMSATCTAAIMEEGFWYDVGCSSHMSFMCQIDLDKDGKKEVMKPLPKGNTTELLLIKEEHIKINDDIRKFENKIGKLTNLSDEIDSMKTFFDARLDNIIAEVAKNWSDLTEKMKQLPIPRQEEHRSEEKASNHGTNVWLFVLTTAVVIVSIALILLFFQPNMKNVSILFKSRANSVRLTDDGDI
ncbi:hypothetical protein B4U79_17560 [Dinothrombium tinctorium]|uniref:C-type lectin domain-containing protein n=1 Tax=Dinothrombium tinctorium TaxID=1965070 RepID=A0A3S3S6F3_9ACAR|nr:hypothetical protein B4U79_17560 [Dinothrombium tinctorium]